MMSIRLSAIPFLLLTFFSSYRMDSLVVGSESSVSRQEAVFFPSSDSDNNIRGFASFENGFYLEDYLTTCTFDSFFPTSECVNLNGGTLYLQNDIFLDSHSALFNPGTISGNFHAMEFVATDSVSILPSSCTPFSFKELSDISLGFYPIAVDWSFDSSYLGLGNYQTSGQEIRVYYFDGLTLSATPTVGLETNKRVLSLRWHPTDRFFAVGYINGSGNEIQVYKHNVSNGTIEAIDGIGLSGNTYAVAWHPSGNYLAAGSTNSSKKVIIYAFNAGAGTLTEVDSINLSSNRYPLYSALSFSPDGQYLAAGTIRSGGVSVQVLKFDGASLISDATVDTGGHCYSVDWHSTDSLISAGSAGSSNTHRIYEHNRNMNTLSEKVSARTGESSLIFTTHWHKNGKFFVYGNSNGSNSRSKIFLYNKSDCTVKQLTQNFVGNLVIDNRWSPDENYLASAAYSSRVLKVFSIKPDALNFKDVSLIIDSPVKLGADWKFTGQSKLVVNGAEIDLSNFQIQVAPHSCLEITAAKLCGLSGSNLSCLYDDASIILKNCILKFDTDFSFSTGWFECQDDVIFSGTAMFNYFSSQQSKVNEWSKLIVNNGLVFNYLPSNADKTLICLTGKSSNLCFDGSTLMSSHTGLFLNNGRVIFSNLVTLSNDARYYAEGFEFGSDLEIIIESDAQLDMHGYLRVVE